MLHDLSKEQQLIILGLILLIVSGFGVMAYRRFTPTASSEILIEEPKSRTQNISHTKILVHIAGAINQEGVYKLKAGDRIVDALSLAGGASALADLSSINLAEKVKDGQKVIIPKKRLVAKRISGDSESRKSGTSSSKVSINAANAKELMKVKGIGKTTAQRIIEYRSSHGPFSKVEDIMKVKSIGKSKFGKIKGSITI